MSAAAIIVSGATIYIFFRCKWVCSREGDDTHAIFLLSTVRASASSSTEGAIITKDLTLSTPPPPFLFCLICFSSRNFYRVKCLHIACVIDPVRMREKQGVADDSLDDLVVLQAFRFFFK